MYLPATQQALISLVISERDNVVMTLSKQICFILKSFEERFYLILSLDSLIDIKLLQFYSRVEPLIALYESIHTPLEFQRENRSISTPRNNDLLIRMSVYMIPKLKYTPLGNCIQVFAQKLYDVLKIHQINAFVNRTGIFDLLCLLMPALSIYLLYKSL